MLRRHMLGWLLFVLTAVGASFMIGCGQDSVSMPDSSNADSSQANQELPKLAKATLHINGFKKSKSGAT